MKASARSGRGTRGSGTYVLVLRLSSRTRVEIGKLGRFDLRPGYYCYVGSAFGSGGVFSRPAHLFRPVARPHWHVDHLRKVARVEEAWYTVHDRKREHQWAAVLSRMPDASIAIPRFGSSDCRYAGHLLYFRTRPTTRRFARSVRARPGGFLEPRTVTETEGGLRRFPTVSSVYELLGDRFERIQISSDEANRRNRGTVLRLRCRPNDVRPWLGVAQPECSQSLSAPPAPPDSPASPAARR